MKIICDASIWTENIPRNGFVDWLKTITLVKENSRGVYFEIDSESPAAPEFVARLKASGEKKPMIFWRIEYSKEEIENAKLLMLYSSVYIAEVDLFPPSGDIRLARTKHLKSPRPFGSFRPFSDVVGVKQPLKERLEKLSFKGIEWVELHAKKPKPEDLPIWRIYSSVELPPSPIPLKNSYGEPFDGDLEKGCHYEKRFREVELSYDADAIARMGEFDVAVTREWIGNYPGGCFQHLVVSQRFRRALGSEKVKGASCTPVRILEPGEPPVRDPLELLASGGRIG